MATIHTVSGETINIRANTVSELREIWGEALIKTGSLLVIGPQENPEAVINPVHIVVVSE